MADFSVGGENRSDIHIRIHPRSGRKTLTTIQGIRKEYDLKRILKQFKQEFGCNGTIVMDEKLGEVIQLQGDHRDRVREFLIGEEIIREENLKVHGF